LFQLSSHHPSIDFIDCSAFRTFLVFWQAEEHIPSSNQHHIILQILPLYLRLLHHHDVRLERFEHRREAAVLSPWLICEWVPDAVHIPRRYSQTSSPLLPFLLLLHLDETGSRCWKLNVAGKRESLRAKETRNHVIGAAQKKRHAKNTIAHPRSREE
jgi:hypothetical protein